MRSPRFTFLVSLVLSAVVHAALLWQLPRWARPARPAAPRKLAYAVAPAGTLPDPPPSQDKPIGETTGVGDAINASPGEQPQSAPKSMPDQAAWTRDPSGPKPAERPMAEPLRQSVVAPPPAAVPTPPESKLPSFRKPDPPTPPAPPAEPPRPAPPAEPTPPRPESPAGGTPMPHSDQDSDPFAKEVTVEFSHGRVVVAPGRQLKFTRPKINLAMIAEAGEISLPARVKLRVIVSPDGTPKSVAVAGSCGSISIDRAILLAAYASWYEPSKDAAGLPITDAFVFTVSIN